MPARRSGSPVGHYGIPLPCELLPRYRFTVRYNTPKQRIDAATSGRPTGSMPRAVEKMCVDEGVRRMPEDCARHLGPSAIRVAGRRTLGSSYDVSSRIPTPGPPNRPQKGRPARSSGQRRACWSEKGGSRLDQSNFKAPCGGAHRRPGGHTWRPRHVEPSSPAERGVRVLLRIRAWQMNRVRNVNVRMPERFSIGRGTRFALTNGRRVLRRLAGKR